ncbi:MAG: pyrroline-5-carboxylate reductase [Bacillus sp. (in: firmicutes)]
MLKDKNIAFLGAGSMAEAMISGIVCSNKVPPSQITVSNHRNKERLKTLKRKYNIQAVSQEQLQIVQHDIIILAMKPQNAEDAIQSIAPLLQSDQLILSVIAGLQTSYIEGLLPSGQQVIRVMPNTSSMIGESATALSSGKHTTQQNMELAKEVFQCIGGVFIIAENQMDIFTGISGSGPAYLYYLMEHMEKVGIGAGLPEKVTREIIAQTFLGAAKMVQEQELTPTILRKNVTSPNGTTAAGLQALSENGGGKAISEAIKQAAQRSKLMSQQLLEKTIV